MDYRLGGFRAPRLQGFQMQSFADATTAAGGSWALGLGMSVVL